MKLTLANAKPVIARVLGKSQSSPEVIAFLNEAIQRLMVRGNWRGTVVRYRIAVNDEKLTWPRQIETVLKVNVGGSPIPLANRWYEFAGAGPGTTTAENSPGLILQDLGTACSFDDIEGIGKTILVTSDEVEDADSQILIQGYDQNNNWIRTLVAGVFVNGEYVNISPGGAYTTHEVINLTGVIKPQTNGRVYLYEHDVATGVNKPLAMYEHDEENPEYRRSRIPSLADVDSSGTFEGIPDGYAMVEVLAKLAFIEATEDTDILLIGNLPAIKDMVQSIVKAENNLAQEADYYESRAIRELEKELVNYEVTNGAPQFDIQSPEIFGAGTISGVI
jgi:hypothetical protein